KLVRAGFSREGAVRHRRACAIMLPRGVMISHPHLPAILAIAILLESSACAPSAGTGAAQRSGWEPFVSAFLDQYFAFSPAAAVNAGRHEFDGKLPDWSAAGLTKFGAFLKDQRA